MEPTSSVASELSDKQAYLNLWGAVQRRKWQIACGVLVGLALAILYCVWAGPFYESKAQLLVIKKRLDTSPIFSGPFAPSQAPEDYLPTHIQVITSPRVVERAVQKNDLASLASFRKSEDPVKEIIDALGATTGKPKSGEGPSREIVQLSCRGKDPGDCARVLHAVIGSYEDFLKETYRNVNVELLDLVTRAHDVLQKDLDAKTAAYREFRKNTPVLWRGKDGNTLHQDRLFSIDAKKSALRMRQAEIRGLLAGVKTALTNGRSLADLLDLVSGSPNHRELLTAANPHTAEPWNVGRATRVTLEDEHINLQLHEDRLLEKFGPDHPEVRAIRKRITTVRTLISPSAAGPDRLPEQAHRLEQLVRMKIQLLKGELSDKEAAEKALDELLERDEKEARVAYVNELRDEDLRMDIERTKQLYESLVRRLKELESIQDYGGYNTQVLAPPEIGLRYLKKYALVFGVGLFAGLLVGVSWAFVADVSDKRFHTALEIRQQLHSPVIGNIPRLPPLNGRQRKLQSPEAAVDPLLWAQHSPDSPAAEAFRAVRTALSFGVNSGDCKVVQVTSPSRGDGKTTLVANLAVSLAQAGKRVLLIDADLRNPRLHTIYGLPNDVGLSSVLADRLDPAAAIRDSGIAGLFVLPAGPPAQQPAELLALPRLKEVLEQLRDQYDLVLCDTPPLLAVTDPSIVAPRVDGVLLNIRVSKQDRLPAERAKEILDTVGSRVLGIVVNGVHDPVPDGSYRL